MVPNLIDVWDWNTFDEEIGAVLMRGSELIRNYAATENQIFLEYDHGRSGRERMMRPSNPYAGGFLSLKEEMGELMRERVIRAWHYTRLTPDEVRSIVTDGLHVSTPTTLKFRLNSLVQGNLLDSGLSETIYAASPFHSSQLEGRSGKFCVVSHPIPVNDSGVERLLKYWGGEVASFWMQDPEVLAVLARTGKPRVLELAVPLAAYNVRLVFGCGSGCRHLRSKAWLCRDTTRFRRVRDLSASVRFDSSRTHRRRPHVQRVRTWISRGVHRRG